MTDALPTRLAVARLLETGGPAAAVLRPAQERPLQGYCLLTGSGAQCRITIYLENGSSHEAVLEGDLVWLQQEEARPESRPEEPWLGMLAGAGAPMAAEPEPGAPPAEVAALAEAGQPGRAPILAGGAPLAAEQEGAAPGPGAPAGQAGAPAGQAGAPAGEAATPDPPTAPDEDLPDEHIPDDREVPRDDAPAEGPDIVGRVPLTNPFAIPPTYPVPDPFAMPAPVDPTAPEAEPYVDLFKVIQTPAIEVTARPAPPDEPEPPQAEPGARPGPAPLPPSLSVPLEGRHPLTPRAGGTVHLNFREGKVQVVVRGLPIPAALGRDATTDRPYSVYRVWLVSQRGGNRQPLGMLARVWGENFRLESEPDLPLARYDTVLITAEDRSQPQAAGSAPQVLLATYGARS